MRRLCWCKYQIKNVLAEVSLMGCRQKKDKGVYTLHIIPLKGWQVCVFPLRFLACFSLYGFSS